ncbi:MAG: hypothetical protein ACXVXP_08380 [Mycobacteriaceae bacterium]
MAHHNSTPRSILDAPVSQPAILSDQRGYSRQERRHGVFVPPGTTSEAATQARLEALAHGPNKPHENVEQVVTVKAPLVRRMVRALRGSKRRAA